MSKKTLTIEQLSEKFASKEFTGTWVCDQLRFLLGRVLTIIDASIADPRQNKAIKDVIKGEFIDKLSHVSDVLSNGMDITPTEEELLSAIGNASVEEDVALGIKG